MNRSFTFVVLTYNHEEYILDHLESIKFQIEEYGSNKEVDIIIADDFSKDKTVNICEYWLNKNKVLFNKIKIIDDGFNRGTCKNLMNAISFITTDNCKLTAGDDIYSYENLFEEFDKIKDYDIMSGLPLNLIDGKIIDSKFDLFNLLATNIIYKSTNYLDRLKGINFFNAPSTLYSMQGLKNNIIKDFVSKFAVTEDYPLSIKMSEIYNPLKFLQSYKIFVYYRRTSNSTYIIKNTVFEKDKIDIFEYLIKNEKKPLIKVLLRNRLYCFKISNKYLKKILNINVYIYGMRILINYFSIKKSFDNLNVSYISHQNHHDKIMLLAKEEYTNFKNSED